MTLFALMDEWLACTGDADDAWLALGLDLLDAWQTAGRTGVGPTPGGQPHLAATLDALHRLRPVATAPDPVALALWFHHCADLDGSLVDRLAGLAGPALAIRVQRLVQGLAEGRPRPDDPAAVLLHAAHRSAQPPGHLARVQASRADQ